jgi:hypothetical protein
MPDRHVTFSQGNDPPSYFELRQKADELVDLLAKYYGLSQQQQQNVRRSIVLVLHKTIPAMFTRNVQAPLDLKLCAQYRERLLAYLHRVFGSSQSATDASR